MQLFSESSDLPGFLPFFTPDSSWWVGGGSDTYQCLHLHLSPGCGAAAISFWHVCVKEIVVGCVICVRELCLRLMGLLHDRWFLNMTSQFSL